MLVAGYFAQQRGADNGFATGEANTLLTEQGVKLGNRRSASSRTCWPSGCSSIRDAIACRRSASTICASWSARFCRAEHERAPSTPDEPSAAHRRLLETIGHEVALFGTGDGAHQLDRRVRDALARVPREQFVPADLAARAYDNRPLPIGHGQTISQPLIVALMTQLLRLDPIARVLEIGTGSGYQTAVLAELAAEVVTVEVVADLAATAEARTRALGYDNVEFHIGDGAAGCPERAVRCDHGDRRGAERATGVARSAGARRPHR